MSDNGKHKGQENPFEALSEILGTLAEKLPQNPEEMEKLQKKHNRKMWGVYFFAFVVGAFAGVGACTVCITIFRMIFN